MARLKPETVKIERLEEADLVLKEIGILERELENIDAKAQERIGDIKADAVKKGEPMRERIVELSSKLGAYAEYNKSELFKDKKTVDLTFGIFGYRKSTSIHIKKTTLELLKKLKLKAFIRIKEEVDKDKMADMADEQLVQVDAVRKIKDEFFLEANREEINKELLKSQV